MYAMLTGATLLIFAVAARLLARSAIHPSVAMPITWGLGLIGVSLASLIGFYRVESDALLIFLFGVCHSPSPLGVSRFFTTVTFVRRVQIFCSIANFGPGRS